MKICAAGILLCILVIGIVSAIPVNPAAVQVVKTAVPAPQVIVTQYHAVPVTMAATEGRIIVTIDSVPDGANVRIDGTPGPQDITPCTATLPAGTHTFINSKSGYRDYTTSITLTTGMAARHISANLERIISPEQVLVTPSIATAVVVTPTP